MSQPNPPSVFDTMNTKAFFDGIRTKLKAALTALSNENVKVDDGFLRFKIDGVRVRAKQEDNDIVLEVGEQGTEYNLRVPANWIIG